MQWVKQYNRNNTLPFSRTRFFWMRVYRIAFFLLLYFAELQWWPSVHLRTRSGWNQAVLSKPAMDEQNGIPTGFSVQYKGFKSESENNEMTTRTILTWLPRLFEIEYIKVPSQGLLRQNPTKSDRVPPSLTKSDQIWPNPTKSDIISRSSFWEETFLDEELNKWHFHDRI